MGPEYDSRGVGCLILCPIAAAIVSVLSKEQNDESVMNRLSLDTVSWPHGTRSSRVAVITWRGSTSFCAGRDSVVRLHSPGPDGLLYEGP